MVFKSRDLSVSARKEKPGEKERGETEMRQREKRERMEQDLEGNTKV